MDEDAQVNFLVVLENGYELESITAEPAANYKNFKGYSDTQVENMYRITKVVGELTITVTTKAVQPPTEATEATGSTEATEATGSTEATEATQATETTEATQAPTQAPATTIKFPSASKTIYVNDSITVKATVKNGVGTTTYVSSNTKVATVNKTTGKVTGKKAGTVTIKATNNGKVATMKVKVVKHANPMKASGKTISASSKKTKAFAKAKAFKITGAKGTVTFKKSKGNKKIAVSSKGKVTVTKGLKKGTYKVKVKVKAKGNTAYKAKTQTVTVTVKVK